MRLRKIRSLFLTYLRRPLPKSLFPGERISTSVTIFPPARFADFQEGVADLVDHRDQDLDGQARLVGGLGVDRCLRDVREVGNVDEL